MIMTTRRAALALPFAVLAMRPAFGRAGFDGARLSGILATLERENGGRLGVVAINHATGGAIGHRAEERFALCSTFKFVAAAFVLSRVDAGKERLDRPIKVSAADIVAHSPLTEPNVGGTMTVDALCHAIMTVSDNAGANLLLRSFGGPEALTAYARSLGDPVTRLDRYEPDLNIVQGDEVRDTTSPLAMAELIRVLAFGTHLSSASRTKLIGWMRGATTGLTRLRAGLPSDWVAGDKTGTGENGETNDIAAVWAPDGPPIAVAAYYVRPGRSMEENAAVLAEVGKVVAAMI